MPRASARPRAYRHGLLVALSLIAAGVLAASGNLAAAAAGRTPLPGLAQVSPTILTGTLNAVWGDPPPGSRRPEVSELVLTDDQQNRAVVVLDPAAALPEGGPLALDRQRVTLTGTWVTRAPSLRTFDDVTVVFEAKSIQRDRSPGRAQAGPVSGSQPWMTILCRFASSTDLTPHPRSWFETLLGGASPGLDHFWRELSYGKINLSGSQVVGWYNLPRAKSYYAGGSNTTLQRLADDCTAVADAEVYFPSFIGVNLMVNEDLGCCAWGGSWMLDRDGQLKSYAMTWLPDWGYKWESVVGHEMGHGFGLPHSSGPYKATYDSQWDVMSQGGICSPPHPEYGCLPVHTIGYHKDRLAWIPVDRKYVAVGNSDRTITLQRLAQAPSSGGSYLLAQIPIGSSVSEFYTVEARRLTGYDNQVPREAVVIHRVDNNRDDRLAQVVDSDSNGDPNDSGAGWAPGETFVDGANEISVVVVSGDSTGFQVRIMVGDALTSRVDLVVSPVSAPSSAPKKSNVTYVLKLANDGPSTATNLRLAGELKAGKATFVSDSSTGGCDKKGKGGVVCELGSLASGANKQVTLVFTAKKSGSLIIATSASADEADLNSASNQLQVTTQVVE